jgi:spore photoproduct lyase
VAIITQAELKIRNTIVSEPNCGRFWKPCPGTTQGYLCCGYQILTPLTGCGMYCRYCILQSYFEKRHQVVFSNWDDLVAEVTAHLADRTGVVRVGTGEFADSLFLEPKLGLSRKVASLLAPYPNVIVEFKTKSVNVAELKEVRNPSRVIIGFSMNTPRMIDELEAGTAALKSRLEAAAACEAMGFWVAFHFDPMIWYPGWEREYRAVVDSIFAAIQDPARIAWWSMGGFRTVPELRTNLKARGAHLPLFSGEMVLGEDRKLRYFRPIRVDFYRLMQAAVRKYAGNIPLYLCMESPEVWRDAGMLHLIPHGLQNYLDNRAVEMLGLPNPTEE